MTMNTESLTDEELMRVTTDPYTVSVKTIRRLATELQAVRQAQRWQPIESIPTDEATSFLVLWENDMNAMVAIQASWFEGALYPDHLGGNVDWEDRIKDPTHWQPLPSAPERSQP